MTTALLHLALQGLTERNPASHAIMYVGIVLGGLLVVMVGVEIFDWLRERLANRRAGIDAPDDGPGSVHVRPPESELRHRHSTDVPKVSREQRPNVPTRHRG
jgi:hypothetical protein